VLPKLFFFVLKYNNITIYIWVQLAIEGWGQRWVLFINLISINYLTF